MADTKGGPLPWNFKIMIIQLFSVCSISIESEDCMVNHSPHIVCISFQTSHIS